MMPQAGLDPRQMEISLATLSFSVPKKPTNHKKKVIGSSFDDA